MKRSRIFSFCLIAIFSLALAACQQQISTSTQAVFGNSVLTPFYTATQTPTGTATPENFPTITPIPSPTATPKVVVLKEGDTLWTIAAKAGLTKEQILAANPGLNPYALSAGIKVIVPAAGAADNTTPSAPTPTALAVVISDPKCSASLTGGLYCFAMVNNPLSTTVQGVNAQFVLTNAQTKETQTQPALLPLSHLSSGTSLPLFAYFSPSIPSNYAITVQLFSALPDSSANSTYIPLTITKNDTKISSDGYSASINAVAASKSNAAEFWVAAVAYDSEGNAVGVRQYSKTVKLTPDTSAAFTLDIYSISGKITNVVLFGEASASSN